MKIAIVIGTRAEFIKMFPVMLELQKQKINYYFIHTGQHKLTDLCETFGTKKPDVILSPEPDKSSKFNVKESEAIKWGLKMIFKIRKELKKLPNLEFVIFHGDTMSTACASIASSTLLNPSKKYQNIHLESGLRSGKLLDPFPEEIIRRLVMFFSNRFVVPSRGTLSHMTEYRKINVMEIGNTILDSADIAYKLALKQKIKPLNKNFVLISIHRHENIKNEKRLKKIVEILLSLEIPSYFTLHDNTSNQLVKFGLYHKLLENKNIKIIKPLDYVSMIFQISKCKLLIVDGGSIQEESLIFQKSCIILRNVTERQEGLDANFQYLSQLNVDRTKEKIKEYLSPNFKFKNPYGEVGISKKIVELLT